MVKIVGARLSRKLKQKMQIIGDKLSCLDCVVILVWHRLLGILLVPLEMVPRIEKRFSTASIGIYLQVSYAFQLEEKILRLTKNGNWGIVFRIFLSSISSVPPRKRNCEEVLAYADFDWLKDPKFTKN